MPYVHSLLSKIPDDLPFEYLASYAGDLFIQFPPEELALEAEEQAKARYEKGIRTRVKGTRLNQVCESN